ncbi:MAG: 23S rRNA (pseudouridine(1915)-N(3))-methyltransferase RlmH [Clostridiales bacterium]|jgi:23S rRNA (pseudouridine1915-N3)-methyltransferase|nr:23S rRNA (pseudouridine(1915)-N(3))-methyltransferase RlmH [Clostridiales bacterium]
MKLTVICVGKLKEKYLKMGIEEYAKRLSRYCNLEIIELQDEKTPDHASETQEELIRKKEGERILKALKEDSYCIALAIEGKMLSSEELAEKIANLGVSGNSHISFLIGGSLGLSQEVLHRADYKLSFSKMTFPHQLMRMILLEQIYRSYRINHNQPYHK